MTLGLSRALHQRRRTTTAIMKATHTPRALTEDDRRISERIRWLRQSKDMTLEEVASEINISWQMLYKYENGQCRLGASRLSQLAKAYKVPISFIADEESVSVDDLDLLDVPGAVEILEVYAGVTDEREQQLILDFVRAACRL